MEIPAPVNEILLRLRSAGHEAYVVGGCVRDMLLGRTPGDWDLCTSALPREVEAAFPDLRCLETGISHGTVTVLCGGMAVEITTYRTDGDYADGRHPTSVTFTPSLTEDLARRDFTCNAMAWDGAGEVVDPFGGRGDLERGLLRCVGKPAQRFHEDALRILRALRFAARYGFAVEAETGNALHHCRELLCRVSPERCLTELRGILLAPHAPAILGEYGDVLHVILPEIKRNADAGDHAGIVGWPVALRAISLSPPVVATRFALLLCAAPSDAAEAALRRLRADNALRDGVTLLRARAFTPPPPDRPAQRREISALGIDRARMLADVRLALSRACGVAVSEAERGYELLTAVEAEDGCLSIRQLSVNGADLLTLGYPIGPSMGRALQCLLDAVMDETVPNERGALLAQAAQYLREL